MAMTSGFLNEPQPECLGHSIMSAPYGTDLALQGWAKFVTTYTGTAAERFVEATEKFGETTQLDQTAYNLVTGTNVSFFEHVGQDEERAALFAQFMRGLGQGDGMALEHALEAFDWTSLGEAQVVDVSPLLHSIFLAIFGLLSASSSYEFVVFWTHTYLFFLLSKKAPFRVCNAFILSHILI